MKALWRRFAERIDSASLRERVMVFAACALVIIAILDFVLVEPALLKQRRLSRDISQRQAEIAKIQAEIKAVALQRQAGPDKELAGRLEESKRRIGEFEVALGKEQRRLVPPEQVGALLEEMLSRNRKLELVELKSLPVADLAQKSSEPSRAGATTLQKPEAALAAEPKLAPEARIYRHGVEITITGGYLDLLAYLRDLERLPRQMYWGQMDLKVLEYPQISLKLSVFTLSLDPAWLIV